jgi:L-asparaginase / beta-aspartyl-peptidase
MRYLFFSLAVCIAVLCWSFYSANPHSPVLVIHGGAGYVNKATLTPAQVAQYEASLRRVLDSGYILLNKGWDAVDVVEICVSMLEDDSLFNAGRGAVLTADGKAELDASIMDGRTRNAGAVATVSHIKNPVKLARRVMDSSAHVFLIGNGAEIFATEQGLEKVPNAYFITHRMKSKYEETKKNDPRGTVGAVAMDKKGNIAAATSTGGMWGKRYGRAGDVPVIGSGTYADNRTCGVSCTGWGEYFIRNSAAFQVNSRMAYGKATLEQGVTATLKEIKDLGGDGGIIAIDKDGNYTLQYNTSAMFRGAVGKDGKYEVKIWE